MKMAEKLKVPKNCQGMSCNKGWPEDNDRHRDAALYGYAGGRKSLKASAIKTDVTEDYLRHRQFSPSKCAEGGLKSGETFANLPLGKTKDRIIVCRLKGKKGSRVQSYLEKRSKRRKSAAPRSLIGRQSFKKKELVELAKPFRGVTVVKDRKPLWWHSGRWHQTYTIRRTLRRK